MTFSFIGEKLAQQKKQARFRQTQLVNEQNGRDIIVNKKSYINFSSNDYLGLNHHPEINKAMQEGVDRFGTCASASSLVTGYQYAHQQLEASICEWLNKERCLLFSSGFSANLGVLQALGESGSQFWLDKLSHASLLDGAYASKAKVKRFKHNDLIQLERLLFTKETDPLKSDNLIISEGVFSMDGDTPDLNGLTAIAKKHQAWTYIDDAHSIGVIGQNGSGSASVTTEIDIIMANFGKAVATSGAFVACDQNLYEYLVNFSRHYIYSTAMPPAIAWATKKSIELIQKDNWRREKIIALSNLFSSTLDPSINLIPTDSSIHAIVIGSEEKTLAVCNQLKEIGIWLTAIRPPTVAINSSRLRVTICSSHNDSDIKLLANTLNKVLC